MNKIHTEIPKRQKCVDKEEPYIGGAIDIYDDVIELDQQTINQRTAETTTSLLNQINNIVGGGATIGFTLSKNIAFVGTTNDIIATATCSSDAIISISKQGEAPETSPTATTSFPRTFTGIDNTTTFVADFNISGVNKSKTATINFVLPISYGLFKNDTYTFIEMTTPKLSSAGLYTITLALNESKFAFKVPNSSSFNINKVMTVGSVSFQVYMDAPIVDGDYKIYISTSTYDSGTYTLSVS